MLRRSVKLIQVNHSYIQLTGGVQIIGMNSRFIGYFVFKTKKTQKKYQKIQG